MSRAVPLAGILLLAVSAAAAAQDPHDVPGTVVRAAERSVSDDSGTTVTARWRTALARDSTDRAALLGLATVARMTYDFPASQRLLLRLLARAPSSPDQWTVQARLGLYSLANAQGNYRRADSLLRSQGKLQLLALGDRAFKDERGCCGRVGDLPLCLQRRGVGFPASRRAEPRPAR